MRWAAMGIALAGAAVAVAGGLGLGPAPHGQVALGLGALALGAGLVAVDWGFGRYLRNLGLRSGHLTALQRAMQAGDERGRAAVDRLRNQGLPGRATVLSVKEVGASFHKRSEVDLELEIQVEGQPSYRVRQRHLVPWPSLEKLKVGEVLPVRIDPESSERLLIDWRA